MSEQQFTSNIQKGGALLDDSRRLVEAWDTAEKPEENLARIASENLLGKTSQTRTEDVLLRILKPRFVDPGGHVIRALKHLLENANAFKAACYYETARDDALVAAFAEGPLSAWWNDGRSAIGTDDVVAWLAQLSEARKAPDWGHTVRTKIARGLLAALRDFGVLQGATRKEIASPTMTPAGFSYVAWREHERGASARRLIDSSVWSHWLLDQPHVMDLFRQAARLGVLQISQAGSVVRIDWLAEDLEEVAGAAA